jgi:PmbA protein
MTDTKRSSSEQKMLDTSNQLIELALKAGADAADAVVFESSSLDASYRLGKLEEVERSESQDLGLRVFLGKQQASVSTTDFSTKTLEALAERAVAMAKEAPEDPFCGLAPKDLAGKPAPLFLKAL